MLWNKEVEIAKSVDDLGTSQSIEGRDIPDFEMLDAQMASALKKLISSSEEEQMSKSRMPKNTTDSTRKADCYVIYDHFRATAAYDAALVLSDLFTVSLQGDDSQDFDTRWDQAL